MTLAILVGGQSRRMGSPKHALIQSSTGRTLLECHCHHLVPAFEQTLLLCGTAGRVTAPPGVLEVWDPPEFEFHGPLSGFLAACEKASHSWLALLAVDYPRITPAFFVEALKQADSVECDALIPEDNQGRDQWLCGLYRTTLSPAVRASLESGERAFHRFCKKIRVVKFQAGDEFDHSMFSNINSPQEALDCGFGNISEKMN